VLSVTSASIRPAEAGVLSRSGGSSVGGSITVDFVEK
jgi:hypothetical protein